MLLSKKTSKNKNFWSEDRRAAMKKCRDLPDFRKSKIEFENVVGIKKVASIVISRGEPSLSSLFKPLEQRRMS